VGKCLNSLKRAAGNSHGPRRRNFGPAADTREAQSRENKQERDDVFLQPGRDGIAILK